MLIVVGALLVLLLVGGLLGARKRERRGATVFHRHLAQADRALERARASDRGWDPEVLERTVRETVSRAHPGVPVDGVRLVLVDDRPGVKEDRAHYEAHVADRQIRVILSRDEAGWRGEAAD